MSKRLCNIAAVLLLCVFCASIANAVPPGKSYVDGVVLVKFKPGVLPSARKQAHERVGASRVREFSSIGIEQVKLKKGMSVVDALAAYKKDAQVDYVEPDYLVSADTLPGDPRFNEQWSLQNLGQNGGTPGADIQALAAWDFATGGTAGVAAVIDTGIDYRHQDLAANMWRNPAEFTGTAGVDDDGNGYVDDIYGIDAVNHDSDPLDDNGHGTHVAGIIGAVGNNGLGVAGINWNAQIIACKFMDASGSGPVSAAIECLQYLRKLKDDGVDLVASNHSWSTSWYSQALYDAINAQRDILLIASAGNEISDNDVNPRYPGSYSLPTVMAVANTDNRDQLALTSSYGKHRVHLGAPGSSILSTTPNDSYALKGGTSMATPHVTGAAALLKAQDGLRSWQQLKNLLLSSGQDLPALQGLTVSGRRLDLFSALTCTDKPLFAVMSYSTDYLPGQPATVEVLSINCDAAAGPVQASTTDGAQIVLNDDGAPPDFSAGDGTFSGSWVPSSGSVYLTVASPSATEVLAPFFKLANLIPATGTIGAPYSHALQPQGGTPPYTLTIVSGQLPAGLVLDSETGVISGVPAQAGSFKLAIQVTDAYPLSIVQTFILNISDGATTEWSKSYNQSSYDAPVDIDVDKAGNIFVVGQTAGPASVDSLLVKYDALGNLLWNRTLDSGGNDYPRKMALDASGGALLVGDTYNGYNWLIARYGADGTLQSSSQFDNGYYEYGRAAAYDTAGDYYLTGLSSGVMLTHKYNPAGELLWSKSYDAAATGAVSIDLATDLDDNGLIAGNCNTRSALGQSGFDLCLLKYDALGNLLWTRSYDGGNRDEATGVAVDALGNAVLTGLSSDGSKLRWLTQKYDPQGNLLWTATHVQNETLGDGAVDVALDRDGYVYVVGGTAAQLVKYDPLGNMVWSKVMGGSMRAVAADDQRHIYTALFAAVAGKNSFYISKFRDNPVITLADSTLAVAYTGSPYQHTLAASGGTPPYAWDVVDGSLTGGLTLDGATGMISGTPTTAQSSAFMVRGTDANGLSAYGIFTLDAIENLQIVTSSLPEGTVGMPYQHALVANGGVPPYAWATVAGTLPLDLQLDAATGIISGTPSIDGIFALNVVVSDANGHVFLKDLSLSVVRDDIDRDGFSKTVDCNDSDASVYPGAVETAFDGIDQDCNGYDLTIRILKAVWSKRTTTLTVEASSSYSNSASAEPLTLSGYGVMTWNKKTSTWKQAATGVEANPGNVTVFSSEGAITEAVTTVR